MRPRLLDLFCCEGGAAVGYRRAGFEVVGVDLCAKYRKRYPFDFIHADAIEAVSEFGGNFDAIHASPPCHAYLITCLTHAHLHPDLIDATREALVESGKPYVIENVDRAPLRNPVRLCGGRFGLTGHDDDGTPLRLERHRLFESNVPLDDGGGCLHDKSVLVAGIYGHTSAGTALTQAIRKDTGRRRGYVPPRHVGARLLGVDWHMTRHELNQAVPPAYTEHLGRQLLAHLEAQEAAA